MERFLLSTTGYQCIVVFRCFWRYSLRSCELPTMVQDLSQLLLPCIFSFWSHPGKQGYSAGWGACIYYTGQVVEDGRGKRMRLSFLPVARVDLCSQKRKKRATDPRQTIVAWLVQFLVKANNSALGIKLPGTRNNSWGTEGREGSCTHKSWDPSMG